MVEYKNKRVVYVLQEEQIISGSEIHNTWVFDGEEKAKDKLYQRVELFKSANKDWSELEVDGSPTCFECYEEGRYLEEHYWIVIEESEVL